jgi:hypothetical protein
MMRRAAREHNGIRPAGADLSRALDKQMALDEALFVADRSLWSARASWSKLTSVTAREILLQHFADLSDDDVHALLPIVQHLRAKRIAPESPQTVKETPSETASRRRHPERFGPLAGSVRFVGDVESPVEMADAWTCDEENLKP